MAKFYLSIGANLGDRMATLHQAVRLLADTPGVTVTAVSPFYETPPWGKTDQPAFINGAVAVDTELSGQELLDACLAIEQRLGRVRHEKWGARTIDIDLVYSPDETCQTETLTLPHPYVIQRAFVLVPLRDLAPDLILCGRPIGDWLDRLPDTDSIRKKDN
ncbi:MAG: 2-amino-4-hydroxy-6-hydroxymethyldihydropteridine diphosphokinase [Megasphaera sp.]|uniref:2-amino-4-hydroxy-6- hydroxymethyldihydropteridine diphosphokinase n=1 Tax=Megasphaera sp. TaxID=2023260 RepID=UPI003F06A0EB